MKLNRRSLLKASSLGVCVSPFLPLLHLSGAPPGKPKFVGVDGIRTRYFEGGSGEALVLIHGGRYGSVSYSANVWSLNFDALCRHFHVYAFDKLGMGYTDNPRSGADYTMAAFIRHAYGFLQAMGITKTHLLGHSMGAMVAARIAIEHPEMTGGLVVLDSKALAPDDPSAPEDFYVRLEEDAPAEPTREFVRAEPDANSYSNAHVTGDYVDEILRVARLPKLAECKEKARLTRVTYLAEVRDLKNQTLGEIRAGRLKAPTLIIWGFNDPSAPLILGQRLMEVILPSVPRAGFHVFNRSGHYTFREHAQEVNRLVADFILQR
ncbi:MAG: alpha/beta hydrolase [Acidobacteria bacterium]|nr:alpha/beta hydrolase [Acidobacteriota bacterium]